MNDTEAGLLERLSGEIQSFRGEFGELAAMMESSWSLNKEQALLYSEEFLRSAFEYPGSSFDLAPAIYTADRIEGFCAAFPRTVRLNGRNLRMAVVSFLTVAPALRDAGRGLALWGNLMNRVQAAGFDGTLNFCVEGDGMHRMMPGMASLFGLNSEPVFRIEYMSRFLRPVPPEPEEAVSDSEIDLFLDLAGELEGDPPLSRTWTREEAIWQCRRRFGAVSLKACHESRRGMLSGYITGVTGPSASNVAILEDVLWGDLTFAEQSQLLQRFLRLASSKGARSISCPVLRYASMEPLEAAGFRRSRRILHAWLTLLNDAEPAPLSSLYIDVF
jgi:hypothetical protein